MSHVLAISVGPVQEFIVAARRTRDLWFGSYLLSEISKSVAMCVRDQGGKLIFPHPDSDLQPGSDSNVANVILSELDGSDPKLVAAEAKKAAQDCWLGSAVDARNEASGVVRADLWDEQVNDVIEFYAAWVKRTADYKTDRARVMRLLAGRKNCRDFLPAKGRAGVPKSSLDGQRETVLSAGSRENWPQKLRLSDGEQLDVVGITKRLGKEQNEADPRYPSVARVAAETWLRGIDKQGRLQPLKDACQPLVAKGLRSVREDKYQYFPFEGTIVFKNRHPDLIDELRLKEHDLDDVAKALEKIGGEPNPYLAVLVADGDKMGETLSRLNSPDDHRKFSTALAGFAVAAKEIVNDHHGVLVYAGGDDVLGFVPVDRCLDCARQLHDKFGELLTGYGSPTLSVGIAIGHFMENLEDLLEYGRAAEKHAKQPDRDGLAIHLHKRGGSPIRIRSKWKEKPSPDERLTNFARLMNDGVIPAKLPYELREMSRLYDSWGTGATDAIRLDLIRLVAKKQSRGVDTVQKALEGYLGGMNAEKLLAFADELLVARQIATALVQAGERPERVLEAAS